MLGLKPVHSQLPGEDDRERRPHRHQDRDGMLVLRIWGRDGLRSAVPNKRGRQLGGLWSNPGRIGGSTEGVSLSQENNEAV
jgi:hypothetical protein